MYALGVVDLARPNERLGHVPLQRRHVQRDLVVHLQDRADAPRGGEEDVAGLDRPLVRGVGGG